MDGLTGQLQASGYWDSFYRTGVAPQLPSQFALFVANELATGELPEIAGIIDLGCGNGRDSLFFAELGYRVIGLDQSGDAIAACREKLLQKDPHCQARTQFEAGAAEGDSLDALAQRIGGPVLIYSRFFFHAIDAELERQVLHRIGIVLKAHGGCLAAEYRTLQDAVGVRETGEHYRRYIDPAGFAEGIAASGLELVWSAEGRGMAKYRGDDAHVARMIARPW